MREKCSPVRAVPLSAVVTMLQLVTLPTTTTASRDVVVLQKQRVTHDAGGKEESAWLGHELAIAPLLGAIRHGVLPILDALGTGMYPVKMDISGNLDRLEIASRNICEEEDQQQHVDERESDGDGRRVRANGARGSLLFNLVRDDMNRGSFHKTTSTTKALLWLKRAMEFTCQMLRMLVEEKGADGEVMEVREAAEKVYVKTLKPFHGWITQGAFNVALRLVPTRQSFLQKAGDARAMEEDTLRQLSAIVDAAEPVLQIVDAFLKHYDLDDPTVV